MIRGSQLFRVGPVGRQNSKVKFPISHVFEKKKVCAVSILYTANLDTNFLFSTNKYALPTESVYLNLYDAQGIQFVRNQNAALSSYINWGRINTFSPRFIDASKCYFYAYMNSDERLDFNLVIYFS